MLDPRANGSSHRVDARPVVHDRRRSRPVVRLGDVDRDARPVPQPVRDEVAERLTEPGRVDAHLRPALDGHGDVARPRTRVASAPRSTTSGREREAARRRRGSARRRGPPRRTSSTMRPRAPAGACGNASASALSAATGLRSSWATTSRRSRSLTASAPRSWSIARAAAARSVSSGSARNGSDVPLVARQSDVAERDERVPPQPPRVVARHEEAVELLDELRPVPLEPVDERDRRRRVRGKLVGRATLLDAAVPRADVLADVAAVDAILERVHHVVGHLAGGLRPVREAARRVEHAGLVERARRTRVDAEPAAAATRVERAASASTSTSVTSVPSTTQEPCVRVISIVFLPMNPTPERSAPARSTCWFASTSTRYEPPSRRPSASRRSRSST